MAGAARSPEKIQSNKDKIEALKIEAQQAERQGDYGKVAEIRYGKIQEAEKEIAAFQEEYKLASANGSMIKEEVDAQDVAEVVSRWTGIPVTRMLASEREKLLHMEDELHKRVIGQEQAIAAISDAVRRSRAGLNDPRNRSARSSSSAPPASARPSWPRHWPSSSSTTTR